MNLDEAMAYTKKMEAEGKYRFDGCTFAPELGIHKFCIMHDTLRVYQPNGMSAWGADKLFFQGICSKGFRYYPVAVIYWSAVRLLFILNIRFMP